MKSTIVPAQITSVEDKIAGSLSAMQIGLLAAPVFVAALDFLLLPPGMQLVTYKILAAVVISLVAGCLAIRFRGQVMLIWLIIVLRYNLRPRYFVATKSVFKPLKPGTNEPTTTVSPSSQPLHRSTSEQFEKFKLDELQAAQKINLGFSRSRKGKLNVFVSQIK